MNRFLVVLISLLLLTPRISLAWGAEGHRLTGLVAQALLTPFARSEVNSLLPAGLADAANFMDIRRPDLQKKYPGSAEWHYDDIPVCDKSKTGAAEYCQNGRCASAQIAIFLGVLGDSHSTLEEKREALRLIVHMVGDIHQPLHAATNGDRGGNLVMIMNRVRSSKLHAVWDTQFVKSSLRGSSESSFAANLVSQSIANLSVLQSGNVRDWIQESHQIAIDTVYGKLPGFACNLDMTATDIELPAEYKTNGQQIVVERIAAAGARIAWLINRTLRK